MVTSWERKGIQKGREDLILKLLNHRFGQLEEALKARIIGLDVDQLDALALALMDFSSLSDLTKWLDHNGSK